MLTFNVSTIFIVKNINHALFKIIPNIGRANCRQGKPCQTVCAVYKGKQNSNIYSTSY